MDVIVKNTVECWQLQLPVVYCIFTITFLTVNFAKGYPDVIKHPLRTV